MKTTKRLIGSDRNLLFLGSAGKEELVAGAHLFHSALAILSESRPVVNLTNPPKGRVVSEELMDVFLKETASRKPKESGILEFFSTTMGKGRRKLSLNERDEMTQIYGIALNSLPQDEAACYSACAKKMRTSLPLTQAETDQMLRITTKPWRLQRPLQNKVLSKRACSRCAPMRATAN